MRGKSAFIEKCGKKHREKTKWKEAFYTVQEKGRAEQ